MILEKMNEEGFVFLKYEVPEEVLQEIKDFDKMNVPCHQVQEPGLGGTTWEPPIEQYIPKAVAFFKNFLSQKGLTKGHLHFDLEKIKVNDFHFLHTHFTPAHYQLCAWFPLGQFEGREFVFGEENDLQYFKPSAGDLVFFKPNDPVWLHGTTPLRSGEAVYSIGITCSPTATRYIARDRIIESKSHVRWE
jgi:hypothetical protein